MGEGDGLSIEISLVFDLVFLYLSLDADFWISLVEGFCSKIKYNYKFIKKFIQLTTFGIRRHMIMYGIIFAIQNRIIFIICFDGSDN